TGQPIGNAIVWQSRISGNYCERLRRDGYGQLIQQKTGLLVDPYFSATKLQYLLDTVSGLRERAERGEIAFGTVDSFLIWRLTGGAVHVTDISNASRTMLFNIHTRDWDDELLGLLGIPRGMLPDVRSNAELLGETTPDLFGKRLPIMGCAGDQQAATFGQACFATGDAKNTYGTGCFMLMNAGGEPPLSDRGLLTTVGWELNGEVTYCLEGSIFVAGAAVQWLRDGLGVIEKSSDVGPLAATVNDADGVYFVPAFVGLGAPYWDSDARGTIVGLTRASTKGHIARATIESMAFQTYDVLQSMQADSGIELACLRVDGGATACDALLQFQADLLNVDVLRATVQETTAQGAAYFAGLASGNWGSLDELKQLWASDRAFASEQTDAWRTQQLHGWHNAVACGPHEVKAGRVCDTLGILDAGAGAESYGSARRQLSHNVPTPATAKRSQTMPILNANQLKQLGGRILEAAGVSPADAEIVASELAEANLVGHDSHGVMRLMQYVQMIEEGFVKPGGEFEVVKEAPAFAVIDGHFNFGQVTASRALALGIEKARSAGTATIMIRNCNHVGRLGSYTHRAAREGLAALMSVNAPGPGGVSPFGGVERRLGTNPISMAAPSGDDALVLDMTTSATAEGKLRVAHQKGESVPDGMIIDGLGKPSIDPAAYYTKPYGSILPLGGPLLGHKGYGMAVMVDVFCGIISGSGVGRTDLPRGATGVWLQLIDIQQFLPMEEYGEWMGRYREHIQGCPKAPGVKEILLPGDIETRRRQEREESGVPIPDETWRQLTELAGRLSVELVDRTGRYFPCSGGDSPFAAAQAPEESESVLCRHSPRFVLSLRNAILVMQSLEFRVRTLLRGVLRQSIRRVVPVVVACFCLAPIADAVAAEPVFTNAHRFRIPFQFDAQELQRLQPREVQLFVSTDQGGSWQQVDSARPSDNRFTYEAPVDGTYWFAVRTIARDGRRFPGGDLTPGLQVVVDTQAPSLMLDIHQSGPGEVLLAWEADDAQLDADSLSLEVLDPRASQWRPLNVALSARGETSWSVASAGMVQVRGRIRDLAANETAASERTMVTLPMAENAEPKEDRPDFTRPVASQPGTATLTDTGNSAESSLGNEAETETERTESEAGSEPLVASTPGPKFIATGQTTETPPAERASIPSTPESIESRFAPVGSKSESSGATSPTGKRRHLVNSLTFRIGYEIQDVGPSGVARVDLYITENGGQKWFYYGRDADLSSPIEVTVPRDGTYGFTFRISNGVGSVDDPPQPGEQANIEVVVDREPPTAVLNPLRTGQGPSHRDILITWKAEDRALAQRPVALFSSASADGPWDMIAGPLANTGQYMWTVPETAEKRLYVRMEVRDEAGNVTELKADQPLLIDHSHPTARVIDVESVSPGTLR
ncbi:Glycerol kinase (ATP:glycerol 3-phosphotransferase) (Glycerokinase) (GK), partial [Durusdinium trenchii]